MPSARPGKKPTRTSGRSSEHTTRSRTDPVRLAVARAYLEFHKGGAFRSDPPATLKQPPQRAMFSSLLRGLARNQRLLMSEVERLAAKPLARLDEAPVALVMLGLLQLRLFDTPPHAAVFETVALAPTLGCKHAKGWINALLRRAQREGLRGDTLPLPQDQPAPSALTSLGVSTSHPDWMVQRWSAHYGALRAEEICRANNRFEGSGVRPETRRISADQLRMRLGEEGIEAHPHPMLRDALWLERLGPLLSSQAFREGLCYVQDTSSQIAMQWLRPVFSGRVLDTCAAPGGKLTHLLGWSPQSADQPEGHQGESFQPVGADSSLPRLAQVRENLTRLRLPNIPLIVADGTHLPFSNNARWDAVLLDAPCSATGMIRKYPELKWRKHEEDIPRFAGIQQALLREGARVLRPGGHLVYITCSLEPEENELGVATFLQAHPGFHRRSLRSLPVPDGLLAPSESLLNAEGDLQLLPGDAHMGLYAALLVKT